MKPSKPYDLNKIRVLLIEDIEKFCNVQKVVRVLRSKGSPQDLHELKVLVSSSPPIPGEATLYSAVVLAIFNDPAGRKVLDHSNEYWTTNSGLEELHVAAAKILLGEDPAVKPAGANWRQMSPRLSDQVKGAY